MSLFVPSLSKDNLSMISFHSEFLRPISLRNTSTCNRIYYIKRKGQLSTFSITLSSQKVVRDPSLDRHVVRQNKIRFVQKLKTLLLSKPKHYLPLHILAKCRSYLSLQKPRSLLAMIHRYPSIFEVFRIPTPPTPLNATKSGFQLCVRLTPAAEALAARESSLKSAMSVSLATKLQKLLMLSTHHRLLLSKLVHIAPDLGLPINFKSSICNTHPDKFKTIDTSYGRALELVTWDPLLAVPLSSSPEMRPPGLIIDRPLKFKRLRLRKGLNVKRRHQDFLFKFQDMEDVCPYRTKVGELSKVSLQEEKRGCAVVREVLGMMVEKRTLVDHLTHFRNDFGLPNKLRGMLVRHPDLFYVSIKGQRDSVFLVEGYNENGVLLEKDKDDGILVIKDKLMELVTEGKKRRRERRNAARINNYLHDRTDNNIDKNDDNDDDDDYVYGDFLDDLFENEDSVIEDGDGELIMMGMGDGGGEYWTANALRSEEEGDVQLEPW